MAKRVSTQNSGQNLYKIEGSSKLIIYHMNVGLLTDSKSKIGSARNLEDALSIIKSHSGSQIKEVREW